MRTLLSILFLVLATLAYGQESGKGFADYPEETIFSKEETISGYTKLICELPDGKTEEIYIKGIITPASWKFQQGVYDKETKMISDADGKTRKAILTNAKYPADAIKKKVSGTVEADCIVETDGSLSNIRITNSVSPSIDQEALRLFSTHKLLPCKINGKAIRSRHRVALSFQHAEKLKQGTVWIADVKAKKAEGVLKNYFYGVQWTETTTATRGWSEHSWVSGNWFSTFEIDIPQNKTFESILCKKLYGKGGKSIEKLGPKAAKAFRGKLKYKEFKGYGNIWNVEGRCLSYKPEKYYSYWYMVELVEDKKSTLDKKIDSYDGISHNIIYDIRNQRLLTIADVITPKTMAALGINAKDNIDLALNEHFLYIGSKGNSIATISLSQDNWHKFAPTLQNILGSKSALPTNSISEDIFDKQLRLGLQPISMPYKIVSMPSMVAEPKNLGEYLTKNLNIPDSVSLKNGMDYVKISYVIEKDGTISHIDISDDANSQYLMNSIKECMKAANKWQPLKVASAETKRSYNTFNYLYRTNDSKNKAIDRYNQLEKEIKELDPEIQAISTEYEQIKADLSLTDKDIDFYFKNGYWSIPGNQNENRGYINDGAEYYKFNIITSSIKGHDVLNKEIKDVISKDVYGEVIEDKSIWGLFYDYFYLAETFNKGIKGSLKGNISCSQSYEKIANIFICAHIDYKDDYRKIERNRGLIYDIHNKSTLKINDVLTPDAIQTLGINGKDISMKLTADSLYLTDYDSKPARTIELNLKNSLESFTEPFKSQLAKIAKISRIEELNNSATAKINKQKELKKDLELLKKLITANPDNNTSYVEEEKVYEVVEQMPEFPDGPQGLFNWLSANVKYPAVAEENGVQGRVIVTFVVERDGSITDVRVVKSVDPSLDKEAARVIKSMPRWIPGKQKGETVRVKYTVPVTFRLQ